MAVLIIKKNFYMGKPWNVSSVMFSNPWRVIIEKAFVCFYIIIGIEKLERAPNKKRVPNQCLLSRLKFKGLRVSNSNIDLKRLKQAKTESQKTAFVSCSNKLINIIHKSVSWVFPKYIKLSKFLVSVWVDVRKDFLSYSGLTPHEIVLGPYPLSPDGTSVKVLYNCNCLYPGKTSSRRSCNNVEFDNPS